MNYCVGVIDIIPSVGRRCLYELCGIRPISINTISTRHIKI